MARAPNRVTENQVAYAVVQIAKLSATGIATFSQCRRQVPTHLSLSPEDLEQSETRPNEAVWEQQIRNIRSHYNAEGNYIFEGYLEHVSRVGYRVTAAGRMRSKP
jgi:hypothetical protein